MKQSEYGDNVYYCEVCLPGKRKVLQHFLSLLEEAKIFLIEKGHPVNHFEDTSWVCDLAFLTFVGT